MEMIEKCARAICRLYAQDEFQPDAHGSKSFEFWIDNNWKEYASDVRTVIQAMREPTSAMRTAAGQCDCIELEPEDGCVFYPHIAWQAMIDAALSGKSGMGEG